MFYTHFYQKLAQRKRYKAGGCCAATPINVANEETIKIEETLCDVATAMETDTPGNTGTEKQSEETNTSSEVVEKTTDRKKIESNKVTNKNNEPLVTAEKSIEEMLREAAESVVAKTGFVYDESSGLYYDWNLKMYYDPNTQLYFDHENGIYYYFDAEKKSYIFHSQVNYSLI